MRLWKYNKITGFWNVVRAVTSDTAVEWLQIVLVLDSDAKRLVLMR